MDTATPLAVEERLIGRLGASRIVRIPADWQPDHMGKDARVRLSLLSDGRIMLEALGAGSVTAQATRRLREHVLDTYPADSAVYAAAASLRDNAPPAEVASHCEMIIRLLDPYPSSRCISGTR